VLALGNPPERFEPAEEDGPLDEETLISLFKDTFDAQEVEEPQQAETQRTGTQRTETQRTESQ